LQVTTDTSGLPPVNPKFTSPAMGGWQPDYSKYDPELGRQVRRAVEKERAIYD
jgi:hypothetical protein